MEKSESASKSKGMNGTAVQSHQTKKKKHTPFTRAYQF